MDELLQKAKDRVEKLKEFRSNLLDQAEKLKIEALYLEYTAKELKYPIELSEQMVTDIQLYMFSEQVVSELVKLKSEDQTGGILPSPDKERFYQGLEIAPVGPVTTVLLSQITTKIVESNG